MHTLLSLPQLERSPSVHTPFLLVLSFTQFPLYDSTFKEAIFLLEKAENIRVSLKTSLTAMLSSAECETFCESFEAASYALSAILQGKVAESRLQFHSQNPYITLSAELCGTETGLFFENCKLFLRTALETQQILAETREKLNEIGHKVSAFSTNVAELGLSFIEAAALRRILRENLENLAENSKKLASLELILRQFSAEKQRFFKFLNEFLQKSDEIGLRGFYEKRFAPRDFCDLLTFERISLENAEKVSETSNFLRNCSTVAEFEAFEDDSPLRKSASLHDAIFKRNCGKLLDFRDKLQICAKVAEILEVFQKNARVLGHLSTKTVLFDAEFGVSLAENDVSRENLRTFSIEFLTNGVFARNHDIYSFGVLVFETFYEKEAWAGLSDAEIVREKKKLAFFQRNPRLGKGLDEIIEKCVDFEEDERPSATTLREMLEKVAKSCD